MLPEAEPPHRPVGLPEQPQRGAEPEREPLLPGLEQVLAPEGVLLPLEAALAQERVLPAQVPPEPGQMRSPQRLAPELS